MTYIAGEAFVFLHKALIFLINLEHFADAISRGLGLHKSVARSRIQLVNIRFSARYKILKSKSYTKRKQVENVMQS